MSQLPVDQRMARVNLSEEQWLEFRALAIREKRSVAAYLGRLVEKEIGRMARVEQRRSQREIDEPNDAQVPAPANDEPGRRRLGSAVGDLSVVDRQPTEA